MKLTLSRTWLAVSLITMAGIAWLDVATGKEFAVWALYLLPVGITSWLFGARVGLLYAVIAALLILIAGLVGGNRFSGTGWFLLAIANRFFALALVSWLASRLFQRQMLESKLSAYEECLDYLNASPEDNSQQPAEKTKNAHATPEDPSAANES